MNATAQPPSAAWYGASLVWSIGPRMVTDGDLRRWIERHAPPPYNRPETILWAHLAAWARAHGIPVVVNN